MVNRRFAFRSPRRSQKWPATVWPLFAQASQAFPAQKKDAFRRRKLFLPCDSSLPVARFRLRLGLNGSPREDARPELRRITNPYWRLPHPAV
jgi:hypothetical protein